MEEKQRESKIGGRARHTQNEKRAKEPEEILEDREEISQTVILLFRRLVNKKKEKENSNSQPTNSKNRSETLFFLILYVLSSRNEN